MDSSQTVPLAYGWNAVWVEVTPRNSSGATLRADQAFASDSYVVDRIASPIETIGVSRFTTDPGSLFNQGGWEVWAANPGSGETASIAVRANHAYLVHVAPKDGTTAQDGDTAGSFTLQGAVEFYRPVWTKGTNNLVGFGVEGTPTFASLMAGSGIMDAGTAGASDNVKKLNPVSGAWVKAMVHPNAAPGQLMIVEGTLGDAAGNTSNATFGAAVR